MSDDLNLSYVINYQNISERIVRGNCWNRLLIWLRIKKRPPNETELINLLADRIIDSRNEMSKNLSIFLYGDHNADYRMTREMEE